MADDRESCPGNPLYYSLGEMGFGGDQEAGGVSLDPPE